MSGRDIIDTILIQLGWGRRSYREDAEAILAALRERYAIVELPKPLEPDDECSSVVFHAADACMTVRVRMGEIIFDTGWYRPKEARSLAAALLAAADAVEVDQ